MSAMMQKRWVSKSLQFFMLLVVLGLVWGMQQLGPGDSPVFAAIAGLGLLFLGGALISQVAEVFGLPHLTGYLLAGMLVGPYVLNLIDHDTVEQLGVLNQLALALIALAGGAELRLEMLRESARSLAWAHLFQTLAMVLGLGATFYFLRGQMPFLEHLSTQVVLMIALLWGVLAATRSPSALLALMAQYRPKGPLTDMTVGFVMSSDLIIVVLLALCMTAARTVMEPGASFDLSTLSAAGHELLGSGALGTTLGLILIAYLRLSGRNLLFVLLLLGLPMSALLKYIELDPLLSFMVAGFVVQNFSRCGDRLLEAIEGTADIVFVVFFATAGAHLDLYSFASIWQVAAILAGVRIIVTFIAARAASRVARDTPVIRRWGWSGLVSQAGLALGIAIILAQRFPEFGEGFAVLAVGVIGINEILGPIFFKIALDRTGESHADG